MMFPVLSRTHASAATLVTLAFRLLMSANMSILFAKQALFRRKVRRRAWRLQRTVRDPGSLLLRPHENLHQRMGPCSFWTNQRRLPGIQANLLSRARRNRPKRRGPCTKPTSTLQLCPHPQWQPSRGRSPARTLYRRGTNCICTSARFSRFVS